MKYIAFVDTEKYYHERRSVVLASSNVARYMAGAFSSFCDVEIISPARSLAKTGFYHGRTTKLSEHVSLTLPPSIGVKSRLMGLVMATFTQFWLLMKLLFQTERGETICVYHSLSIMQTIKLAKIMKKLRVIVEVREIYTDVHDQKQSSREKELDFFKIADGFIVASKLLDDLINPNKHPSVLAPGIYKVETNRQKKFDDGKIHVVYAGTFRAIKGGALAAVRCAEFLPENYTLHILGRGEPDVVKNLTEEIEKVSEKSKAMIVYEGVLFGEEFKAFLQKCHIGLSTQNPEETFNNTSFPSKVLTYLVNGLEVVSAKVAPVVQSPIGEYVHYYEHQDSKEIAECIEKVEINIENKCKFVITELDNDLKLKLKKIIII